MIDKYMKLLEKVYDLFESRKCSAKWFDDTANYIHKKYGLSRQRTPHRASFLRLCTCKYKTIRRRIYE